MDSMVSDTLHHTFIESVCEFVMHYHLLVAWLVCMLFYTCSRYTSDFLMHVI